MQQTETSELDPIDQALRTVTECADILFERAPVMMHSINQEGHLLKVNHRWLTTLGYERDEVIGQKSVDFLTDESRLVAIVDALPLFWQAGSDRSIGYRFRRKNGRVLNVLLDAEAVTSTKGVLAGVATLRTPDGLNLWRQSSTTLQRLRKLHRVRRQLEDFLLPDGDGVSDTGRTWESQLKALIQHGTWAQELFGNLAELVQDISSSLSALSRVHQEHQDTSLEQQDDLLLTMKSIDKTLIEMKGVMTDL